MLHDLFHLFLADRVKNVPKSGVRQIFDTAETLGSYINLGIGEPDFDTPDFIQKAAKKAIDNGFNRYTANAGIIELRREIARKLKRENRMDVDPEREVIVTAGATQAIFDIMQCILNPGDKIILPTPIFSAYKYSAMIAGATIREVPLDERRGYLPNWKEIESECGNKTKAIVLNSPCNPTGTVLGRKDIERACELAASNDMYIISDEIYEKYLYDRATHFSPGSLSEFKDKVITINGLSKTYGMTGWRIGYAVGNEDLIRALIRFNLYNAVCANSFVQLAAVSALRHSLFFFKPLLRQFDQRRKLACDYFKEMGWNTVRPNGAFYVFPSLPTRKKTSQEFSFSLLKKYRVATIPGSSFGNSGEGHIRICYALEEDKLTEALELISRFSKEWTR